jgi:hypothetical protein
MGPALPLPQLAVALGLDRVRSAARTAGAIIRLHPAVTLLPGALVAALMTVFVIASADRPAPATGQRARFVSASVSGLGGLQAVAEAVVPAPTGGGKGLDSRAALSKRAQPRIQPGTRAVPRYGSFAWCACLPVLIDPVPAPFPGQLACGRSASRPAPYTAHLPAPCAFAT